MDLTYGSIGPLPFDLMNAIVLQSSIKTAVSIYLSCKYWHDKYKHIINHDTIVVQTALHCIKVRYSYKTIKNGRVSYFYGKNYYNKSVSINRGFFSTVRDLADFLKKFNEILTNPVQEDQNSRLVHLIVRTTSQNGTSKYYGRYNYTDPKGLFTIPGMQKLGLKSINELDRLLDCIDNVQRKIVQINDEDPVGNKDQNPKDKSLSDSDYIEECKKLAEYQKSKLIRIRIKFRAELAKENWDYNSVIHATSDGDFKIKVLETTINIRTPPTIFQEILDIVKYSKHKTDISENMMNEHQKILESFELTLKEEDQLYYIQEYKLKDDDDAIRVENNGYKTNAIKKVLKILERITQHKSLAVNPFLKETIKLPPITSFVYTIARTRHYTIPMYGFTILSSILASVQKSKKIKEGGPRLLNCRERVVLSNHDITPVPIDELMALLVFVEQNMEYRVLEHTQTYKKFDFEIQHITDQYSHHFKVNQKALDKIVYVIKKYYVDLDALEKT